MEEPAAGSDANMGSDYRLLHLCLASTSSDWHLIFFFLILNSTDQYVVYSMICESGLDWTRYRARTILLLIFFLCFYA